MFRRCITALVVLGVAGGVFSAGRIAGDEPASTASLCMKADAGCLALGGVTARVELSPGDQAITTGMFSVRYDPLVIDFVGISPGQACDPESPFIMELFEDVRELAGDLFYAVAVDPFGAEPGAGVPTTMACLNFQVIDTSQSEVCLFDGSYIQGTLLADISGHLVQIDNSQDCPPAAPPPILSCDAITVDTECLCVPDTDDCSALDTDCRVGVCDEYSRRCETQIINNLGPCDDGNSCTALDMCITGTCIGFDSVCSDHSLCLVAEDAWTWPGENSTVLVKVRLGQGDQNITSGQFAIRYDPEALKLIGASPGNTCDQTSPFSWDPVLEVDPVGGWLFYAVHSDPWSPGSSGPTTMACLEFELTGTLDESICLLRGDNPYTRIVDEFGQTAPIHNAGDCPPESFLPDYCDGLDSCLSCDRPGVPIPTLSGWGALVLTLLLLVAAKIHLGCQRSRNTG